MKPSRLLLRAALVFLGLGVAGPASAQYVPGGYSPFSQPRVSPYLNLLRSGTAPGINYYGIVRPEIDFRSGALQQVGAQSLANQQAITGLGAAPTGPPTTGHLVGFQNHLIYFQNLGAAGQNQFAPGLGAPARGAAAAPAGGSGRRR